jgi:ClpP class serine protease
MFEIWACEENALLAYLDMLWKTEALEGDPMARELDLSGSPLTAFSEDGKSAIVFIEGVLTQNGPSPLARLFGVTGTSYKALVSSLEEIGASEEIKTVRLAMNTPGGEVNGVDSVRSAVAELAKSKNVIAENHGMVASAGYWIASAANTIVAQSPAVETGSIGVVATRVNFDKAREKFGIRVVKVLSRNAPNKQPDGTTKKGLAELQSRVDAIERVFIGRIAEGRGKTAEEVAKTFGRGSLLIASDPDGIDALSVGMIDSVENGFAESGDNQPGIAALDKDSKKIEKEDKKKPASAGNQTRERNRGMSLAKLLAEHPALAAEIDKIVSDAKQSGIDSVNAKIETVLPFLRSAEYPESVRNLACDVLEGKSGVDALTGAVTVLDALKAQQSIKDADTDTNDAGETATTSSSEGVSEDGTISSEEQYQAEVAADRKKLGLE